jgi:GNAT superfamily N-acetyltransferase
LTAGLPTCWVALDTDGTACFMMWLIAPRDNALMRAWWGGLFPELQPDEALLEGVYRADSHRGLGIMADAGSQIAERARDFGARYGIGFIGSGNAASLKASERTRFAPYLKRQESWLLFRRRVRFLPLGESDDPHDGPT